MRRAIASAAALAAAVLALPMAAQASWIFRSSYFSHEPSTGERVAQYAPLPTPLVTVDPTYEQSAYLHSESHLQVGDNADHMHVVETWGHGETLRPYGEWLYPFREGATPYGPWGNPQGPWTTPFGSWVNPYGLGKLPHAPWGYGPYGTPMAPGAVGPAAVPPVVAPPAAASPAAPAAPTAVPGNAGPGQDF